MLVWPVYSVMCSEAACVTAAAEVPWTVSLYCKCTFGDVNQPSQIRDDISLLLCATEYVLFTVHTTNL